MYRYRQNAKTRRSIRVENTVFTANRHIARIKKDRNIDKRRDLIHNIDVYTERSGDTMKNIKQKLAISAALAAAFTSVLSSCKTDANNTAASESYVYKPQSDIVESSSAAEENPEKTFMVNTSWQSNFKAKYQYYNASESTDTVTITETKNSSAFTAEYPDGNSLLYYKANGADTDYYVLVTGSEKKAVHKLLKGNSFSELSSTFMKLTKVNGSLPSLSNVLYMYDENIGGRACHKYLQRAYSDGKLTESVYIWIDIEFGFAAKCESYDSGGKMRVMWSLESFETGTVGENDITIDLDAYSVTEEEDGE